MDKVIIDTSAWIESFRPQGDKALYQGDAHLEKQQIARLSSEEQDQSIWPVARRKLDQINRVQELSELKIPPGNRLERLKGDRDNQHSIRINQQYRICFTWEEGHAYEIEITDYH